MILHAFVSHRLLLLCYSGHMWLWHHNRNWIEIESVCWKWHLLDEREIWNVGVAKKCGQSEKHEVALGKNDKLIIKLTEFRVSDRRAYCFVVFGVFHWHLFANWMVKPNAATVCANRRRIELFSGIERITAAATAAITRHSKTTELIKIIINTTQQSWNWLWKFISAFMRTTKTHIIAPHYTLHIIECKQIALVNEMKLRRCMPFECWHKRLRGVSDAAIGMPRFMREYACILSLCQSKINCRLVAVAAAVTTQSLRRVSITWNRFEWLHNALQFPISVDKQFQL